MAPATPSGLCQSISAGAGRGEGGFADYLLYVDGKAAGVIEAKKEGATLTGMEVQSGR